MQWKLVLGQEPASLDVLVTFMTKTIRVLVSVIGSLKRCIRSPGALYWDDLIIEAGLEPSERLSGRLICVATIKAVACEPQLRRGQRAFFGKFFNLASQNMSCCSDLESYKNVAQVGPDH